MHKSKPTLKGKIILYGQLQCCSPLHIGSGAGKRSELDIVLNEQREPFIPATSFVGVLRHAIPIMQLIPDCSKEQFTELLNTFPDMKQKVQQVDKTTEQLKQRVQKAFDTFWGYMEKDDGHQSTLRCSDLVACQELSRSVTIRDGIEIVNKTGIVKDTSKYDYELVEPGTPFTLNMEFSYNDENEVFVKRMATTIYTLLKEGKVRIGAKTTSGFGEIRLVENQTSLYELNFSQVEDIRRWLLRNDDPEQWFTQELKANVIPVSTLGKPFEIRDNQFSIEITLQLKNSLIIRAYSDDPKLPDAIHIKSNDNWVLTGTSLKGAIRARAERIVNTLNKPDTIIKELFGYVNKDNKTAKKGRLRVTEVTLPDYPAELQTRIRIDRFTGGTIEGALFDSMPLFGDEQQKIESVRIVIDDCKDYEAGLLLLVLKDLWSGDLAVGGEKGIGRGVFQGIKATICGKAEPITIEQDITTLSEKRKETLQKWVTALKDCQPYCPKGT